MLHRSHGAEVLSALKAQGLDLPETQQLTLEDARILQEDKNVFHWELEFPEVFVDLGHARWKENPGFDAVVGNPPYDVLAEKERNEDLKPLVAHLADEPTVEAALGGKLDLYRLFVARTLNLLLRQEAIVRFILPMSLLADQQTRPLRRELLQRHGLVRVNAFPQKDDPNRRVFRQAKLPTAVVVTQREPEEENSFTVAVGRLLTETQGRYEATADDIGELSSDTLLIPLLRSRRALDLAVRVSTSIWIFGGTEIQLAENGLSTHSRTASDIQRNAALNNWRRLIFRPSA